MENILSLRESLKQICQNFALSENVKVIERTPYIPYIPENWNGVLVVAEAQNITEDDYRDCSEEQKICRLYPNRDCLQNYEISGSFPKLDVKPWNDGSIPLALKASLELNLFETAVGNSCFWSIRNGEANENPNEDMRNQSRILWQQMWDVLKERCSKVICCGNIAKEIFNFIEDDKYFEINLFKNDFNYFTNFNNFVDFFFKFKFPPLILTLCTPFFNGTTHE